MLDQLLYVVFKCIGNFQNLNISIHKNEYDSNFTHVVCDFKLYLNYLTTQLKKRSNKRMIYTYIFNCIKLKNIYKTPSVYSYVNIEKIIQIKNYNNKNIYITENTIEKVRSYH